MSENRQMVDPVKDLQFIVFIVLYVRFDRGGLESFEALGGKVAPHSISPHSIFEQTVFENR